MRLVDLRINAVTTGVDFHDALKQIELKAVITLQLVIRSRESKEPERRYAPSS